ncbi:SO_0444 family Cu/Zn efflux transporter [Amphritea sp. 1_MG-2023]|uniref:SO_0444 family Cu/Zn efflux transporter n=1 Tax=Amphritea sp. 1_MG-2023 TaxID=3062670 RepID=UPI0026E3D4DF|nr:SO_0444 family Cu/Zn efflux transporter [Amphritea sp. 1_MG-2023]MDO6564889.1 SO_0444 family Cu/Zn efflux transporter [Amphritea sp. 1_MG-2023]
MLQLFFENLLALFLDTAIWLLFGLILAAVLKGWIPTSLVNRWLSGNGPAAVIRAALIGAPLPLCSCGVLPAAIGLRRSGASKAATVSFLVATPETGVDSISVTYALLGPVMAVTRPISAIFSAIVSGMMIIIFDRHSNDQQPATALDNNVNESASESCCRGATKPAAKSCCAQPKQPLTDHCCDTSSECSSDTNKPQREAASGCSSESMTAMSATPQPGILAGLQFAIFDILDDISQWLAIGLILAAVVATLVEPASLSQWGSGLTAMLLMLIVGLPLYICATASTPLAAALLAAGMSPGAILVFLLVGPATNIASLGILSRELGVRAVIIYLSGISVCAILLGLATDAILSQQDLIVGMPMAEHNTAAVMVIKWVAAILLLLLAIKPLRQLVWRNESVTHCS